MSILVPGSSPDAGAGAQGAPEHRAGRAATIGVVAMLAVALTLLALAPLAMPESYSWVTLRGR